MNVWDRGYWMGNCLLYDVPSSKGVLPDFQAVGRAVVFSSSCDQKTANIFRAGPSKLGIGLTDADVPEGLITNHTVVVIDAVIWAFRD